jgi:hypothetical protein
MDRHPGASITLSFALVALFAIILYQPEHTPLPHAKEDIAARKAERPTIAPEPMPAVTAGEPLPALPAPTPAPRVILPAAATIEKPHQPSVILPAQEGFTQALEGETLRDVAVRVYGSADEAEALWRLNRDLVARRDATLSAGTLLRTP